MAKFQQDFVTSLQDAEHRLHAIENGSTLTRPHPKWILGGGGGDGSIDMITRTSFDCGTAGDDTALDFASGYVSETFTLEIDGAALGTFQYIAIIGSAAEGHFPTGPTGPPPDASTYGIWYEEDPDDSDYWKIYVQLGGPEGLGGMTGFTTFGARLGLSVSYPGHETPPYRSLIPYAFDSETLVVDGGGWIARITKTEWDDIPTPMSWSVAIEGFAVAS